MKKELKYNLMDLFNKIHAENNGKQESLLRIKYVPNNLESSRFIVDAELKPSMSDVSYCITCDDGDSVCFELFFKNGCGTANYEFYMQDSFKYEFNRLEDDILKKHYFIFLALINPMFILHQISRDENITELIENNKFSIELNDAELILGIYHDDLVL